MGTTVIAPLSEVIAAPAAAEAGAKVQPPSDVTTLFRVGKLPRAHLEFVSSTDPLLASKIPIANVPFAIGRSAAIPALQADQTISSAHAVIEWREGAFTITDLNSRNGTCVNGRRLPSGKPVLLPFGAVIQLSHVTELTIVSDEVGAIPDFTGQTIGGTYILERMIGRAEKGRCTRRHIRAFPKKSR